VPRISQIVSAVIYFLFIVWRGRAIVFSHFRLGDRRFTVKSIVILFLALLLLAGCVKPPEEIYHHPKTGQENLSMHVDECGELAERFGVVNMSPVHNYPMLDMKDYFQRVKIFRFCMLQKGYEI
jgi:hypothetical protein